MKNLIRKILKEEYISEGVMDRVDMIIHPDNQTNWREVVKKKKLPVVITNTSLTTEDVKKSVGGSHHLPIIIYPMEGDKLKMITESNKLLQLKKVLQQKYDITSIHGMTYVGPIPEQYKKMKEWHNPSKSFFYNYILAVYENKKSLLDNLTKSYNFNDMWKGLRDTFTNRK